ncbi:hypothetical protein [Paraglaciecola psychrophila]|jgi:hypothetical protein|uniref:Uncharacterized protein n=1 Tax=Paraglaciecola psychrophila 170 TaxID=1129794 RepID=K7A617_9ALTE|nr:hypothetical protein [Paraglaciecola psychrophila]AGH44924.1 hypothetical protein C427_2815 [Paraglaciecola psychrophila 170]GAC36278.1 hypothetical protein GPSY_0640 [Paraglaciecola psychrophila 170]
MASLHAFTNNSIPLASMQVPADNRHSIDINVKHANKWTFLVANHIRFSEKQDYCMCITKPTQNQLSLWLEKIVIGGQCSNLFVEQLSLDEISFKRLKQLCIDFKVSLVNLIPVNDQQDNVVKGPW